MYVCPNCDFELKQDADLCPRCNASFREGSTWKPVFRPLEPVKPWRPNEVSASFRFWYALYCVFGLGYVTLSLYMGKFYLPSRVGSGSTLSGIPAYIMCVAVLVGVAHLASFIVDHYDRRNNEERYTRFATESKFWFWGLFVTSLLFSCS